MAFRSVKLRGIAAAHRVDLLDNPPLSLPMVGGDDAENRSGARP
jgi:hypothetical protein